MTLETLNKHFEFREQLNVARELLDELRAKIQPRAQVITGMPRAPGKKDFVAEMAIKLAKEEARIVDLEKAVQENAADVEAYIDTIEDEQVRWIFSLRFLYALQWKEVADFVGNGYSPEAAKSACYRYIKEH